MLLHYETYDSLKYCLCSALVIHLSFFPKLFHLQPLIHLPRQNFSVFFIENMVNPKYNNYRKCFALNQLKRELCALMENRNLCSALCYFTCIIVQN